jgi:hypothetical protein
MRLWLRNDLAGRGFVGPRPAVRFHIPGTFAVPTAKGMASALDLTPPATDQEVPQF